MNQTPSQHPTLVIVNPAAGGGRCGKLAPSAVDSLRQAGIPVRVHETRAAGEATDVARAAYRSGVRDFVGVGGDGTGFEIVNGLFPESLELPPVERPKLGFLPLGTGNSFLRDFSNEGASYSLAALVAGRTRPCDVIRLRHKQGDVYYINILSLGFVADVCTLTNRRFKPLGEAGYLFGVIGTVLGLSCRPIPIAIEGGAFDEQPVAFVSISNSRFTGGKMMMAPDADVADGLVDVVTVGQLSRLALVRTFPKVFEGLHVHHPAVRTEKARSLTFRVPGPLDAMIDGEVISLWPERLDVLPQALEVRV